MKDLHISSSSSSSSSSASGNFSAGENEKQGRIEGGGEEFMMESEVNRMLLQGQGGKTITYPALRTPPVCNVDKYGNCIVQINEYNRGCTLYDRCSRNDS